MGEVAVLDATAARGLTEQIRKQADRLWELVLLAHDGKVWVALGYGSWREYTEAEFSATSRSGVHRLLTQGQVTLELERAAGVKREAGEAPLVSARQAKAVAPRVAEVAEKVAAAARGKHQPARRTVVKRVVEEAVGAGRPDPTEAPGEVVARANLPASSAQPPQRFSEPADETWTGAGEPATGTGPQVGERPAFERAAVLLVRTDPRVVVRSAGADNARRLVRDVRRWCHKVEALVEPAAADVSACKHPPTRRIGDRCGLCGKEVK